MFSINIKKLTYLLILCLLYACSNSEKRAASANSFDTSKASKRPNDKLKQSSLLLDNQFPAEWIDSVKALNKIIGGSSFKISKNCLIMENDTICTPDVLTLKRRYIFSGNTDSLHFKLNITRVNNTDIHYTYTVKNNKSVIYNNSGTVRLTPGFYLGFESPEDEITGEAYVTAEYINLNKKNLTIDIENPGEFTKEIRAIVKSTSHNKFFPEDFTLRAKIN